ncbi:MAG TPA: adenosylcobinamide-GDP ribazoletransferase [Microvirga sp.]|jgi:adenosylcobinamide-GDP ribazoletransferase
MDAPETDAKAAPRLPLWQALAVDTARAVRFYSRLPVPALPFEEQPHALPDFRTLPRAVPIAGLVIGLGPALVLAAALLLDMGPWLAAALGVAAMTILTGAFHEDGLADVADGFGGGNPERRLAIMKDSLIGSFGASAIALALALRIGALATLADRLDIVPAAIAVLIAAALSRTAGLTPLAFLPPARPDGASRAVGQPARPVFWIAAGIAAGLTAILGLAAGLPAIGLGLMMTGAALGGLALTRLAHRLIGGQTGDVAGAAQQLAEIAALLGLLVAVRP